jgi:8-oxo-dGTP pyrophosphatase MutT (NUDIX family)
MPEHTELTIDLVRRALQRPLPGLSAQLRMAPPHRPNTLPPNGPPPREAGVLLLLYPIDGALHFVLTRRTERLGSHSGQISLPGGRIERGDIDLTATALREAHEELGVMLDDADVLGQLTELYVPPSHFVVSPTVAHLPFRPTFQPSEDEVAEVIEVRLAVLFDLTIRQEEPRALVSQGGATIMTPYYRISEHKVWGATAMVLSEFEALLHAVMKRT